MNIQNVSIEIDREAIFPNIIIRWRPVTGEAADLRQAVLQMADQIICEHLESVHRVQGVLEKWIQEGMGS